MWTTTSLWFEIAVVSIIYALGNILLGHFEERTPKVRRVGKYLLTLVIVCGISVMFGRSVAMIFLSAFILPLVISTAITFPRKKALTDGLVNPKPSTTNTENGTRIFFPNRENCQTALPW